MFENEDCGAPIGRDPSRDKGSLSAPRWRRYFYSPCRDALPLFPFQAFAFAGVDLGIAAQATAG